MTGKRHSMLLVASGALLSTASHEALAAPSEPLVVSQLSDPDPTYVPPKSETRRQGRGGHRKADGSSNHDKAMENLGMVIGQAAEIERRRDGATSEQIEAEKRDVMKRLQERMSGEQPN